MTTQNKSRIFKRLAKIVFGLTAVMWVVGNILGIMYASSLDFDNLGGVVYGMIAVLIISRQPRHVIGWLFLVVGFFLAFGVLGSSADKLMASGQIEISGQLFDLLTWIGHLIWVPAFMLPITLVLQFFPDGRLPSRRWWPVPTITLIGMLSFVSAYAFYPYPWEAQGIADTHNPFGIPGSERFLEGLLNLAIFFFLIAVIGSLAAVIVRFRRSQGVERIQMKWLVYTAVVGISALLGTRIVFGIKVSNPVSDFVFTLLPSLFVVTVGISILRHQLFDIDLIIRRTLQYSILTGLLSLVYFGGVTLLQSILSAAGKQPSPVVIVLTTLFIAALFNPLWRRIQDFIDRRFYRQKYDAEKALAEFAAEARSETNLNRLADHLIRTVQVTLQPEQISIWLKKPDQ